MPPGPAPTPPPAIPQTFSAEGVLKEALVQLWEQARGKRVAAIGTLIVRMFDASDAFRLLGAVGVNGRPKERHSGQDVDHNM